MGEAERRAIWIGLRRLLLVAGAVLVGACPDQLTDSGYVLTLSPPAASLVVEDSVQFTATLSDREGRPVAASLSWSVTDSAVASVNDAGWVRALGPGSARVGVTAEGATASAAVTVTVDEGQSLTITPVNARVSVNSVVRFRATLLSGEGDTIPASPSWRSSNPAVATVDHEGRARGVAPGAVTITAAAGGLTAESPLVVEARATTAVLVGAGDIASCDNSGDERTADLLDDIAGIVFTAGDNAYPDGSAAEFASCYDVSWGRHKARTRPAAGNHEYHTFAATPYYDYFGEAAGARGKGYYSYDAGAWHVIVLNSNLMMGPGSPQEEWLRNDLADHPTRCTLAYWHHPRFSSGRHGSSGVPMGAWNALYEADADLIVVAHDHTYERFAPQTPEGQLDLGRGIRQIIVGTGGAGLYEFKNIAPNSEVRGNSTKGVLKLTLHAERYEWEFIPAGGDFTDSGSASCH